MKRTLAVLALSALVLASPALAAENKPALLAENKDVAAPATKDATPPAAEKTAPAAADMKAVFESHKQEILEKLDTRIVQMQELRSCIAAATGLDDMRTCRPGGPGPVEVEHKGPEGKAQDDKAQGGDHGR